MDLPLYGFNLGQEAHVHHSVSLVDNEEGALSQAESLLMDHLDDSARGADDDLHSSSQGLPLGCLVSSTYDLFDSAINGTT